VSPALSAAAAAAAVGLGDQGRPGAVATPSWGRCKGPLCIYGGEGQQEGD
jgi:hypothetical protein